MTELTPLVHKIVGKYFSQEDDRGTVRTIFLEECSDTLPLVDSLSEMERIQLAALKLSQGDTGKFLDAAALARMDWRDVLVAAGFGYDVEAHLKWAEESGN